MTYEGLRIIGAGESLADAAYTQLSEAILRNELSAGSSLSVTELSAHLGISRSPAREAVQRLIHDGLADYRGRRGTVVASPSASGFAALLEVREVLEGLAARGAAASSGSDGHREELADLHGRLCRVPTGKEHTESELISLDTAFHRVIRQMSGNPELTTLLDRIQARSHLSMHGLWDGAGNVEAVVMEHAAICAAVVERDPESAEAAARHHIASLRDRVLSVIG